MENNVEMSVIVLTFNSSFQSIILTLTSILEQEFENYEIIITDDCSKENYEIEIEAFFEKHNFYQYKIVNNKKNVGTVKNYIKGIQKAKGKYIKPIGAGDLFYDKKTLSSIYDFIKEEGVKCGFGLLKGYRKDNEDKYSALDFRAPINFGLYDKDRKAFKDKILLHGDYICGATLFGEKEFLLSYLEKVSEIVRLTEDIIQIFILLDGEEIGFLDKTIIFYEIGSGISTRKIKIVGKSQMQKDHENFWRYIKVESNIYKLKKRADLQIKLINQQNRVLKNLMMSILNFEEFRYNQMRKRWRKGKSRVITEGFLADENFIKRVRDIIKNKNTNY